MRYFVSLVCSFLLFYANASAEPDTTRVIDAARSQIGVTTIYDGSYVRIPYPGGDVPKERGVCTDVIVRAYRAAGYDLQALVHNDMRQHFSRYPSKRIWGLVKPDRNIDHRRVPNLEVFFKRQGHSLPAGAAVAPGDLLTWTLPGNLPHIGLVSNRRSTTSGQYLVIHNIGRGTQEEDLIGTLPQRHHFRFHPWEEPERP